MSLQTKSSSASNLGISFIVFFKNLEEEPIRTIKNILVGTSTLTKLNFEIILIRDGGEKTDRIKYFLSRNKDLKITFIELPKSQGVSNAISIAANFTNYSHACFVPGNDAFTSKSFSIVASNFERYDALLGFRKNRLQTRPLPKVFASKLSLTFAKFLYFPKLNFIKDIHGLNVYNLRFVKSYVGLGHGHGNNISIIIPMLWLGAKFSQVEVSVNQHQLTLRDKILKFPIPNEVFNFLVDLLRLWCVYRFRTIREK